MNRVKSRIESETSEIKEYMYEELIQISNFYNEVFVYLIFELIQKKYAKHCFNPERTLLAPTIFRPSVSPEKI